MKTVTNTANITDEAGGAYKTTYSNTVTTYIRSPYGGGTGRECCELVCVCDRCCTCCDCCRRCCERRGCRAGCCGR